MCGIFGYIGNVPAEREKEFGSLLTRLAIATAVRGRHATGFASWTPSGDDGAGPVFSYAKAPGDARKFVNGSAWKSMRENLPGALVGHTRYSTGSPAKVNRNNHPFVGNRWAIVHNGWVNNYDELVEAYDLDLVSDTDSEAILGLMEVCGDARLGFEEVLSAVRGAVGIASIEKSTGSVYLFRDPSKPLSIVRLPRFNVVLFASTPEILKRAILNRMYGMVDDDASSHFGSTRRTSSSSAYVPAKYRVRSYNAPRSLSDWERDAVDSIFSIRPGRLYELRSEDNENLIEGIADTVVGI